MLALLCVAIISNAILGTVGQQAEPVTTTGTPIPPTTTVALCPDLCSLPPETGGRGKAPFKMWYFDLESHECKRFRYTGRNGNKNNFFKLADCETTCKDCKLIALSGGNDPQSQDPSVCELPKTQGSQCDDQQPHLVWYFDTEKQSCNPFAYFGCGGNGNRFENEGDCSNVCG